MQCAAGDNRAQRVFFDEHLDFVHGILFRILGSNQEIEDLIQESFLEAYRSLASFRGDSKLTTWLARIVVRVAYGYLRRKKGTLVPLEIVPELRASDPSLEARLAARAAGRRLYALLDELEAKQRIAFVLHAIEGLSVSEIARMTDSNPIAVKTRIRRARAVVREDRLVREFLEGATA